MTRENKIQMRMALNENVQESYEELDDNAGYLAICLFDDGLEREEVDEIVKDVRDSNIKQLIQFYR